MAHGSGLTPRGSWLMVRDLDLAIALLGHGLVMASPVPQDGSTVGLDHAVPWPGHRWVMLDS